MKEDLYKKAVGIVIKSQRANVFYLQRILGVSYTRSVELIERMESEGLVGPQRGSMSREILSN